MKNIEIPEGHSAIMPYLMVPDAANFSGFMQQVFDAREVLKHMRDENKIMHGEIQINGATIMFCDSTEEWQPQGAGMFIYVADADEIYQKALNAGATSVMAPANQNYGRSCGVQDPFGNTWWVTSVK